MQFSRKQHVTSAYRPVLTSCFRTVAAGATIDAQRDKPKNTPLITAVIYRRVEMVRLLCQAGADVNYRRAIEEDGTDFPLVLALQCPDIVQVLLQFGADPSMKADHDCTPEEIATRRADRYWMFRESARILKLRPRFRGVFALRALCHRGRATPTSETPEGFALLFFAPASRPRTRAAWRRAPPGLPDPLAHLVCVFWLGEPPRRRCAAPATE